MEVADMSTKRYAVTCHWDEEAEVWYVDILVNMPDGLSRFRTLAQIKLD